MYIDTRDNGFVSRFTESIHYGFHDEDNKAVCSAPTTVVSHQEISFVQKRTFRDGVSGNHYYPTPYRALYFEGVPGSYSETKHDLYDDVRNPTTGSFCKPSGSLVKRVYGRQTGSLYYGPGIQDYAVVQDSEGATARAINAMYEDAKNNKIQLGETLAEFAKTATLIGDMAKTLANSYVHMRRGNFKEAVNELFPLLKPKVRDPRDFQNLLLGRRWSRRDKQYLNGFLDKRSRDSARKWLAWHYGVMPTLMDIDNLHQLALHGLTSHSTLEFRASGGSTINCDPVIDFYPTLGGTRTSKSVLRCRVGAVWRITDITQFNAGQIGFGPQDIPRLLWALVPGSFMIDWFANVDGFLSSLSTIFSSGLTFVTGFVTLSRRNSIDYSQSLHNQTAQSVTVIQSDAFRKCFAMNRKLLGQPPFPFPEIRNPLSLNHMVTVGAILSGSSTRGLQQR